MVSRVRLPVGPHKIICAHSSVVERSDLSRRGRRFDPGVITNHHLYMAEFGVYILQSLKNSRYYTGSTNNIRRRLNEHNEGLVAATRFIRPLELRQFFILPTLEEARKAEYRLKQYKNKRIIEKVIESGIFPWEYKNLGG